MLWQLNYVSSIGHPRRLQQADHALCSWCAPNLGTSLHHTGKETYHIKLS
jgi:hypothetical protein